MNRENQRTLHDLFRGKPPFCTFDLEEMTWRFGNQRIVRTLTFRNSGFFSTGCRDRETGREYQPEPVSQGFISLGSEAGPKTVIDLGRDFRPADPVYTFSKGKDIRGDGVKCLTVHTQGTGPNRGLYIDICYDLYPGNEPWISTWFRVKADGTWQEYLHSPLHEIRFESFPFRDGTDLQPVGVCEKKENRRYSNASIWSGTETGILATVEGSPLIRLTDRGRCVVSCGMSGAEDAEVLLDARDRCTGKAVLVCFDGNPRQALWHYQLFLIKRWLKADCRTMPPWYKTWFRQWQDTEYWLARSQEEELLPAADAAKNCGFAGLHYVIGIRAGHGARDYEQGFVHGGEKAEECTRLMPHGFSADKPGSLPAKCREAGLEFGMHLFWPVGGNGHCSDMQAVRESVPPLIDFFRSSGARFCWYEDVHAGTGNLLNKTGWGLMADSIRAAIPGFRFARTWVREVEQLNTAECACPFDAERQPMLNRKSEADIGDYYSVSREWREWAISHWYRPSYIDITMASVDVLVRDGRGTPGDLDFFLSSQAFLSCMHVGGMIEKLTPEERHIVRKWAEWNWKHREILQYSQPLDMESELDSTNGIMHLAPVREGRIGFIGIWNDDSAADDRVSLNIDFSVYGLLRPDEHLSVTDMNTGQQLKHTLKGTSLLMGSIDIESRGYRILDLNSYREKGKTHEDTIKECYDD